MKKNLIIIGVICVAIAGLIGGLVWSVFDYAGKPTNENISEQSFTVLPGQHLEIITQRLLASGIIRDPLRFKIFSRIKGYDKRIKAGEYTLSAALSPKQVLEIMVSGKVALHKITIPEGFNLSQIAVIMDDAGLVDQNKIMRTASDSTIIKKMGLSSTSLEGYLFPDTYHFPRGMTTEKILATMVNRFREIYTEQWQQRAEQIGMNTHQVVTLASIIEKETGAAFERPLIASVFHNRLTKGMRLSSDPTVIYGLSEFDGNLTRKHLKTPTPYNTYMRKGLPPGPIANPGVGSLEAALYPAETDYLYFVSKKDGTHQFSTNLKAHNRAVRKYQLRRKNK